MMNATFLARNEIKYITLPNLRAKYLMIVNVYTDVGDVK